MASGMKNSKLKYWSLLHQGEDNNFVVLLAALSMILLAFFILLYSFAVVDNQRRLVALDSLMGSFGMMPGGFNVSKDQQNRLLQPPSLLQDNAESMDEALHDFLMRRGIVDDVKVRQLKDGVVVDLQNKLLFSSGSFQLSAAGKQVLQRMADILRPLENVQLTVKGYSDDVPIKAGNPIPSNLSLAALRATVVFRHLVQHGGVNSSAIKVAGYARTAQVTGDTSGSVSGRRVEIEIRGGIIPSNQERESDRYYRFRDFNVPLSGK
jgi:chemotaxis protein MotB